MDLSRLLSRIDAELAEAETQERAARAYHKAGDLWRRDLMEIDAYLARECATSSIRHLHLLLEQLEKISEFETRAEFEAHGPLLSDCEHCGQSYQYETDHARECLGMRRHIIEQSKLLGTDAEIDWLAYLRDWGRP